MLRCAAAARLGHWRADRDQHVGGKIDPLEAVRVEPAHQRRMIVCQHELRLRVEQQLLAAGKIRSDELDRGAITCAVGDADPFRKEGLRQRMRGDEEISQICARWGKAVAV